MPRRGIREAVLARQPDAHRPPGDTATPTRAQTAGVRGLFGGTGTLARARGAILRRGAGGPRPRDQAVLSGAGTAGVRPGARVLGLGGEAGIGTEAGRAGLSVAAAGARTRAATAGVRGLFGGTGTPMQVRSAGAVGTGAGVQGGTGGVTPEAGSHGGVLGRTRAGLAVSGPGACGKATALM